jgi:hypothetical protein
MYILSLAFDQRRRADWIKDPKAAIANSNLDPEDKAALDTLDPAVVSARIIATSGGGGTRIWICIWIKLP